ncbi:MAG: hypothetical protein CL878_08920 [Dehalococcoidia bacterium]|nr:hypothetical protein [Dehalococcoidia bacterium]
MLSSRIALFWHRILHWSAWFLEGRYLLLARLLGMHPEPAAPGQRGTVFIEIDGLGHNHLRQALRQGYLPFLRGLLDRDLYRRYRWRCGLVADTPAAQSGLLYGSTDGIAGFYWFDRASQKRIVGSNPVHMRREERRLAATNRGLLSGGSSYASIISGGAHWNVLTIAGTSAHWYRPGQALLRSLIILLLNPGKVIRFFFDAGWEMVQELEDTVWSVLRRRRRLGLDAFPIIRVLLNILPREIVATGTRLDMLRGVPVIYSCFIGYDIIGHRSGPTSRTALRSLRGIDSAIGKIFETRQRCEREYDIVVLSDHGMTPAQPFTQAQGQSLEDWVTRWWTTKSHYPSRQQAQRIAQRVHRQGTGWLNTWGRIGAMILELGSAGAIKLGERFFVDPGEVQAHPHVLVIPCGSLAQIWVRGFERRLYGTEIEQLAPGFLAALAAHQGIALVITRAEAALSVVGREGSLRLRLPPSDEAGTRSIWQAPLDDLILAQEGSNPLLRYEEPAIVLRQLISFARMEACGDIVCLADIWQPASRGNSEVHTYTFEQQAGCHAAAGGDQSYPFILLPSHLTFDPETVGEAVHMHHVLAGIVDPSQRNGEVSPIPATTVFARAGRNGAAAGRSLPPTEGRPGRGADKGR